jgi:peptide/nickel transport system substrate-binding protein
VRQHRIGTGPFKFVEYKPNQGVRLVRNPEYWKRGRPYLDGVEYTIIPSRSTAILGFVAGNFDLTFPYEETIPVLKDIKGQAPQTICETGMASEAIGMLVNRTVAPVDNAGLATGDGAYLGPKFLYRHSRSRRGRNGWGIDAAPGRRVGNAA